MTFHGCFPPRPCALGRSSFVLLTVVWWWAAVVCMLPSASAWSVLPSFSTLPPFPILQNLNHISALQALQAALQSNDKDKNAPPHDATVLSASALASSTLSTTTTTLEPAPKSSSPPKQQQQAPPPQLSYSIRDCVYSELPQVADTLIAAFYPNATGPWKQLYRMGELNRIQQGFPYADHGGKHRMLVATVADGSRSLSGQTDSSRIVGFVDIDDRPPNRPTNYPFNPRPYLSDLCIHPDYRRQGLAQALVRACEDCSLLQWKRTELYIRVEKDNQAALQMYYKMGYQHAVNEEDEDEKGADNGDNESSSTNSNKKKSSNILLLRKNLLKEESDWMVSSSSSPSEQETVLSLLPDANVVLMNNQSSSFQSSYVQ